MDPPPYHPTILPSYHPTILPSHHPTSQRAYLRANEPTYEPTRLPLRAYELPSYELPSYEPTILRAYQPTSYHLDPTILRATILRVTAKKNHARGPVDTTQLKSLLARPKRGEEESEPLCAVQACLSLSVCLSVCLSICLSVYLSVCRRSVCVSVSA